MTIEQLTALIVALATLFGTLWKWKDLVKIVVSFALKKAMNPNDTIFQTVRDYTRIGIQSGLKSMLKRYKFVDFFLVLRLDKNGKYWISQEEFVTIKDIKKQPNLHKTVANEHLRFWEEVHGKGYFEAEKINEIIENHHFKNSLMLFDKYDVKSLWAYSIPNTKIIIFACATTWLELTYENRHIGDDLSKMHDTMNLLYSYRLIHH